MFEAAVLLSLLGTPLYYIHCVIVAKRERNVMAVRVKR